MGKKSAEKAKQLASLARKLVYLSGNKFKTGVGLYEQALHKAQFVPGFVRHCYDARKCIEMNTQILELYVMEHRAEVLKNKKVRPHKQSIAEPKPWEKPQTVSGVDVASPEFLQTYEWRKVRMEALKKHGARCMCCGASPANGAVMNVDHIKPRKLWPSLALDLNNLQVLCHDCNHGKGNWDTTDWRK
jgi:hypothetical protein